MILKILILLYIVAALIIINNKTDISLPLYFSLIVFTPIFQYYISNYVGSNYFTVEPKRYLFEYSNTILLLIILMRFKSILKYSLAWFVFLLFSSILSLLNSQIFYISIYFYPLGVLSGLISFLVFSNLEINSKEIERICVYFLTANIILGLLFLGYEIISTGRLDFSDRLKGLYSLSNIGMIIMVPFYSFLTFRFFLTKNAPPKIVYIFISIGIYIGLISSLSRTALFLYGIIFAIIIYEKINNNNKTESHKSIIIIIMLIMALSYFVGFDAKYFISRFQGDYSSTSSLGYRFLMWTEIISNTFITSQINNIFGHGLLSYSVSPLNPIGFSNAHNFILNSLYENGIIYIGLIISMSIYVIVGKKNKESKYLAYSFILYFLALLFNNDLYMASGQHSSLPGVIYFSFLGLLFRNKNKNIINDTKINIQIEYVNINKKE